MSGANPQKLRILLIGAGAVGQVYGRHLQLGGAEVAFYVKPKYADEARAGYRMYPLNQGRDVPAVVWKDFGVRTDLPATLAQGWDQVWLCVSTTALFGPWLDELAQHLGSADLVALQPGVLAEERLVPLFGKERITWGGISMISYQTPLDGEAREPGVAYWFPPMGPSPFWGPRAQLAVDALKRGKCPAAVNPGGSAQMRYGSAILMPHLVALEGAGWSFAKVREGSWLAQASAASREAAQAVSAYTGDPVPLGVRLLRPWHIGLLSRLAPSLLPLPIEIYLQYHFTKVGDQTRAMMKDYQRLAREKQLPGEAMAQLVKSANLSLDAPAQG
jgi:hypothetical protein